jgi:quercetin dioxygenase-like cupin family protein
MRIARASDTPPEPMEQTNFTGPVRRRDLGQFDAPGGTALVVSFEAGSRTNWHRHPDGQVLFVLSGSGLACTRDSSPEPIGPGDLVYAPPGEEHWHGAADDEAMSHVALSFGETEWIEPLRI